MLAEEANLGKTRFLAAAGHDILQPLNAARLYCASLIEKAGKGDIGGRGRQHRILAGIGRDDSRRRARHFASRCRRDEAVRDGVQARTRCCARSAPISCRWPPRRSSSSRSCHRRCAVSTDRNLLRRLMQNLVSNAIKYTRSGRMLVGVRRRGELAEIQVIDTGIGIAGGQAQHGLPRVHAARRRRARSARPRSRPVDRRPDRARAAAGDSASLPARARARAFPCILPVTSAPRAGASRRQAQAHMRAGIALNGLGGALHRQRPAHPRRHAPAARGLGLQRVDTIAGLGWRRTRAHPRPTSCSPTTTSTAKRASTRSASCGRSSAPTLAGHPGHRRPLERGARGRRADRRAGHQQAGEAGSAALDDDPGPPHDCGGGVNAFHHGVDLWQGRGRASTEMTDTC